jgi:hypothetical protein
MVERFEEESLVFLAASDCWVRLNRTATDVLESLRADGLERLAADEVARRLRRQYDLEAAYAREVAANLLQEWSQAGMVCPAAEEEP